MNSLINMSEGASLALHSLALLARRQPEKMTVQQIARRLEASSAHLAKVFQKLGKSGLVRSVRGPGGGLTLSKPREEIRLLDIYEAIDGPVHIGACPLGRSDCLFRKCIFEGALNRISREIHHTLKSITLARFSGEMFR